MRMRNTLLRLSIPIQKWLQKIHQPYPLVKGDFYVRARSLIQPGDILLSRETWHLTNLFIPGFWKHAAIIDTDCEYVIEAVGDPDGVRRVLLAEWILTKDYVVILRCPESWYGKFAAVRAGHQVGKKYDYIFKTGSKEFFCNELVAWSYKRKFKTHFGHTPVPTDLVMDPDVHAVVDSRWWLP